MDYLAFMVALWLSLLGVIVTCGVLVLYYAPLLWVYPLSLAYSFMDLVESLFILYFSQLLPVLIFPCTSVLYYALT